MDSFAPMWSSLTASFWQRLIAQTFKVNRSDFEHQCLKAPISFICKWFIKVNSQNVGDISVMMHKNWRVVKKMLIRGGSDLEEIIPIRRKFVHPLYRQGLLYHDVAIYELDRRIIYSSDFNQYGDTPTCLDQGRYHLSFGSAYCRHELDFCQVVFFLPLKNSGETDLSGLTARVFGYGLTENNTQVGSL